MCYEIFKTLQYVILNEYSLYCHLNFNVFILILVQIPRVYVIRRMIYARARNRINYKKDILGRRLSCSGRDGEPSVVLNFADPWTRPLRHENPQNETATFLRHPRRVRKDDFALYLLRFQCCEFSAEFIDVRMSLLLRMS